MDLLVQQGNISISGILRGCRFYFWLNCHDILHNYSLTMNLLYWINLLCAALKIHISQCTADILVQAGSFELEERGEIEMKVMFGNSRYFGMFLFFKLKRLTCVCLCLFYVHDRVKVVIKPTGCWAKNHLILLLLLTALHPLTVSNYKQR